MPQIRHKPPPAQRIGCAGGGFFSLKRGNYLLALRALMASTSMGPTLNRSPTMP